VNIFKLSPPFWKTKDSTPVEVQRIFMENIEEVHLEFTLSSENFPASALQHDVSHNDSRGESDPGFI
jgi:hypothetical protein